MQSYPIPDKSPEYSVLWVERIDSARRFLSLRSDLRGIRT
jgi:hypothetical protein